MKLIQIMSVMIISLLLTNCSNQNKKVIKSPDDLQSFVNVFCAKHSSTEKVIRVCTQSISKDLNIAENKALMNAKLKLADIVSHSLVSKEVITHVEGKGITKTYNLEATSTLDEVSISNYRVVHKKILKENGKWRVLILAELKIT